MSRDLGAAIGAFLSALTLTIREVEAGTTDSSQIWSRLDEHLDGFQEQGSPLSPAAQAQLRTIRDALKKYRASLTQ